MDNESIAINIQHGHTELISQLWEQVSRFIDMQAGKYLNRFPEHYRALQGDMVNQAYFSFLTAIEKYEKERGSFINCLAWYIRGAFEAVIYGGRGSRLKNEPLNQAGSLDIPLNDTNDLYLVDTILDETAEAHYRELEDTDFWQNVNEILRDAIESIEDEDGRKIVSCIFNTGCTITAAARAGHIEINHANAAYRAAIRHMERHLKAHKQKERVCKAGLEDYIYGWGVRSYKNHMFTSSVEWEVIKRIEAKAKSNSVPIAV